MRNKSLWKRIVSVALAAVMVLSVAACGGEKESVSEDTASGVPAEEDAEENAEAGEEESQVAGITPYEETVHVTIGRPMLDADWPEGQSYEDNALKTYYEETLNIEIEWYYDAVQVDDYAQMLELSLASGDLPDLIWGHSATYPLLMENTALLSEQTGMLEKYGQGYALDLWTMDAEYEGWDVQEVMCTDEDGKVWALGTPIITGGAFGYWVRQDWIDELGLSIDENGDRILTKEDYFTIAKAFTEKTGYPAITMKTGSIEQGWGLGEMTKFDGDVHGYWSYDENGDLYYMGVANPEATKAGLAFAKELLDTGLLDPEFATNDDTAVVEKLLNEQIGIVSGTSDSNRWHFVSAYENIPDAEWAFYVGAWGDDATGFAPAYRGLERGIFVSAECEHPELPVLLSNVHYDLINKKNDGTLEKENPEVYELMCNSTVNYMNPLLWDIQTPDAVPDNRYGIVQSYLDGEITLQEAGVNAVHAKIIETYLADPASADSQMNVIADMILEGDMSVSTAVEKGEVAHVPTDYLVNTTEAYNLYWSDLYTLEKETMYDIILGEQPVEAWDDFVEYWYANGGQEILDEANGK